MVAAPPDLPKCSTQFSQRLGDRQRNLLAVARRLPHQANGLKPLAATAETTVRAERRTQLLAQSESERLIRGSNHFKVAPYGWFLPTEPQATSAFVNQLNCGSRAVRLGRAQAFVEATWMAQPIGVKPSPTAPAPRLENVPSIEAEFGTEDSKRIDIILSGRSGGTCLEVIVEAKFGHCLTESQLTDYTEGQVGKSPEQLVLVVVAPQLVANDGAKIVSYSRQFPNRSPWRFADWRTFLINYAVSLAREHDDEEFSRVRHSLDRAAERWI